MAKKQGEKWTATHRYGDVYECVKGDVQLSHSKGGLEAAAANLEKDGGDFAMKQLEVVSAKLQAIADAGVQQEAPEPESVEADTGEE